MYGVVRRTRTTSSSLLGIIHIFSLMILIYCKHSRRRRVAVLQRKVPNNIVQTLEQQFAYYCMMV